MKRALAKILRILARKLDPTEGSHKLNVAAMNRYIGQTEGYIIALEAALRHPAIVEKLRRVHGRMDTKKFRDAGAWN